MQTHQESVISGFIVRLLHVFRVFLFQLLGYIIVQGVRLVLLTIWIKVPVGIRVNDFLIFVPVGRVSLFSQEIILLLRQQLSEVHFA